MINQDCERDTDYVPNNTPNSLSRCAYPLGDSFDPIQRNTVIEATKCRSRGFRSSSLPCRRSFYLRSSDIFAQRRSVPVDHTRRNRIDYKVDFQMIRLPNVLLPYSTEEES